MKNLFVLLLLFISSTGVSQDPAMKAFVVEYDETYIHFQWDTYGAFHKSDFGVIKFTELTGWNDLSLDWEDSLLTISNKFSFTDTLLKDGTTLFYELYRKTTDGPICMKKIVVKDGEVCIIIYPQKTVHNLVIISSEPVHGRVKLFDGDGNIPVDNVMLIGNRVTISSLQPGNYLMELDNYQIQEVFPIKIE